MSRSATIILLFAFTTISGMAGAQDAMFVDSSGNVGVGTNTPASSLNVLRSDGSAQVLVEDTGSGSPLQMFRLINSGGFPAFNMEDGSQADVRWTFRLSGTQGSDERFTITKLGTGTAELALMANGDLNIEGQLNSGSSREIKEAINPVNVETVLSKLDSLTMSEWSYKRQNGQRHLGPMAEDFHATFGLGPDERHIAPSDLAGVALAAAKALKSENERLKEENSAIKDRLSALEARIESLSTQ